MINGMEEITSILPQDLHHAYVIEGSIDEKEELLQYIESTLEIKTRGNPDVHIRRYDVFGIDDGRAIQALESKKAVIADKKIFILHVNSITREAQNAFLKTFEDPTAGTHFFIIIPSAKNLLKTLLSRVYIIENKKREKSPFAKQFLSASAPERLALIADIVESKNKPEALQLINSLEVELYSNSGFKSHVDTISSQDEIAFETLQSVRSYLSDQSSSVKILLEHLSVTLPQSVTPTQAV